MWVSSALPGGMHDLTAARRHAILTTAIEHQVQLWADKAYISELPTVLTPVKGKDLPYALRQYNRRHA